MLKIKKEQEMLDKIAKETHCPYCGKKGAYKSHTCKRNGKVHCLNCGKPMKKQWDEMTGKKSDYIFHCNCMPKEIDIMMG